MSKQGVLYVVSAPSGCGKGTILEQVLRRNPNIYYSVSATTRSPREGEVDGVNYFFYTVNKFKELIAENGVLEYATFCGNYYGTPRNEVTRMLNEGRDVILEIETKGAMQIRKTMPEAVSIFILPPSINELRRRLDKRGTETEKAINKRIAVAASEIRKAKRYDYIMVNEDLEAAIKDFEAIIKVSKLQRNKSMNKIDEVLNNA